MTANPKYSIIVPAHNSYNFLAKCLNSIEDQIFDRSKYELIVVCDACTDDTYTVASFYADKILTTNFGNDGGSRQAGIDASSGDWILFLDDDDWWMHEYVLELIDISTNDSTDMICFGFIFKGRGYARPIRHDGESDIFWPSVWNKCYRKDFIKDIRFNNIQPTPDGNAADIDWTSRLLQKPFSYKVIDQPLYYYNYLRPGSQTVEKVKQNERQTDS